MIRARRILLVLLAVSTPAAAQEWTRFRGPNGTGVATGGKGVPSTWTEPLWKVSVPGEGHAQPVAWGDKLFLCSAASEGRERIMVCLSKVDGKELWTRKLPLSTSKKHKLNSFASSTPAVDADRVYASYVCPESYLVKAWDHAGKELWSVDLGPFKAQHAHGASPMLYDGKLIVPNDHDAESFVVALDVKTGKAVWRSPRKNTDNAAYGTPCLLQREGAPPELLLTSHSYGISSIDPRNGRPNWEAHVFDKRAVSSPVVAGDLVLGTCGSGGGGIYLAAVKLGGKGDVTSSHLAWTVKQSAPYVPTPVAAKDRIFWVSDDGVATCVKATTGEPVWRERVGGTFYASPVLADGRLFLVSAAGEAIVLAASDEYKVLGKSLLGEGSHTTPCIDGNRVYFKTFTHLVCVGAP